MMNQCIDQMYSVLKLNSHSLFKLYYFLDVSFRKFDFALYLSCFTTKYWMRKQILVHRKQTMYSSCDVFGILHVCGCRMHDNGRDCQANWLLFTWVVMWRNGCEKRIFLCHWHTKRCIVLINGELLEVPYTVEIIQSPDEVVTEVILYILYMILTLYIYAYWIDQ